METTVVILASIASVLSIISFAGAVASRTDLTGRCDGLEIGGNILRTALEEQNNKTDAMRVDLDRHTSLVEKLVETSGGFWKTQDGYILQVRQMSENHLQNSRRYLESRGRPKSADLETEHQRRICDREWEEKTKYSRRHLDSRGGKNRPPIETDLQLGQTFMWCGHKVVVSRIWHQTHDGKDVVTMQRINPLGSLGPTSVVAPLREVEGVLAAREREDRCFLPHKSGPFPSDHAPNSKPILVSFYHTQGGKIATYFEPHDDCRKKT